MGGLYGRLAVGDIDGDGRPDLVIANVINGVEVYLQNADGTWKGPIDAMPELKGGAQAVALGDLDGDGKLDLVIAARCRRRSNFEWVPHGLWVRWGDGKGGFSARPSTNLPTVGLDVIWGLAVIDVNRDGRADIVVSTGGATGRIASRTRPPRQGRRRQAEVLPGAQCSGLAQRGTRAPLASGLEKSA